MSKETEDRRETRQFVSFNLAGEEYGIPILRVQEIIRYESLTRVPKSAEFVEGVLNLRGQVVPVIDLRRRFDLPTTERDSSSRIVVIEVDEQVIGLIVDSVSEVRTIEAGQIDPPPPLGSQIHTEFISGMGKLDGRLIILLNLDWAFTSDEKENLQETVLQEA
ncbi:MAG: chemotaxis protein CheW [bacterium]